MTTLLRLDTSLFAGQGVSTQLSDELVSQLRAATPAVKVIHKDFAKNPVPHLDGERLQALMTPAEKRNDTQKAQVGYSDQLIAELLEADTVVIGLPMYNFSVPSMLKAWFDHVARAGTTFKYTDTGAVGLLSNKKVYLITTRGGIHKNQASDTQLPFVKTFLGFLGLNDIETIYAEGLNMGEELRNTAINEAKQEISNLVA